MAPQIALCAHIFDIRDQTSTQALSIEPLSFTNGAEVLSEISILAKFTGIFLQFLLFDAFRKNLRSVGEAERLYREGLGASLISDVENMVS